MGYVCDSSLLQVKRCIFPAGNTCRIRVLNTRNDKKRALKLWLELKETDPIISALNFDPESESLLIQEMCRAFDQNIAYGCFSQRNNKEDELLAVDLLNVQQTIRYCQYYGKAPETWAYTRFLQYYDKITIHTGPEDKVVDFLTSFGVFTKPNYKNLGIEEEMIRVRKQVAKALRIKYMASAFVGSEMQTLAAKVGYKIHKEFGYEDMREIGLDFPIKLMVIVNQMKGERETRKFVKARLRRNKPAGVHMLPSKPLIDQCATDVDEE